MKIAFTYRKHNCFSSLVKHITKSEWSHTFIILDNGFILESAFGKGFHIGLLTDYTDDPDVVIETYDLNDEFSLDYIKDLGSRHYGYLQTFGFLVMKLFSMNHNPSTQGLWCSEAALLILLKTKFADLFADLKINSASPQDLLEIILANPELFPKTE